MEKMLEDIVKETNHVLFLTWKYFKLALICCNFYFSWTNTLFYYPLIEQLEITC